MFRRTPFTDRVSCSRLISIPLAIVMVVAYLTADIEIVKNIFSDPDKFLTADEFLFFYASFSSSFSARENSPLIG